MSESRPFHTDDARVLQELESVARNEVLLPADAHVIGDWLGRTPVTAQGPETARPHKVEGEDLVVGRPLELVVLACKSNALRCRLLSSAREVTLRTAVRDEIAGSIITVTPKKHWTHARHPYLSGEVTSVRIDASVLGLVPLALQRQDAPLGPRSTGGDERPVCRLAQAGPAGDDAGGELLLEAQECIVAGAFAEADELLHKVLALDLRYLDAHALLGERSLSSWPALSLHHFELGVAIGSLTMGEDFNGVFPWGLLEMFVAGADAGFDMQSEAGIDAWMRSIQGKPVPASVALPGPPKPPSKKAAKAKKNARKAAGKARRRNR